MYPTVTKRACRVKPSIGHETNDAASVNVPPSRTLLVAVGGPERSVLSSRLLSIIDHEGGRCRGGAACTEICSLERLVDGRFRLRAKMNALIVGRPDAS